MKKIKIILVCLLVPFVFVIALTYLKIKKIEQIRQKVALAHELRKVLQYLMLDLSQAHATTVLDVPADGMWHNRIDFNIPRQGAMEYIVTKRRLFRVNNGNILMIADNVDDLRIRRQRATPDIMEVEIDAKKNVSLLFDLKVRINPD